MVFGYMKISHFYETNHITPHNIVAMMYTTKRQSSNQKENPPQTDSFSSDFYEIFMSVFKIQFNFVLCSFRWLMVLSGKIQWTRFHGV